MINSPVLFVTFARPNYARHTWDAIKAAKPKSLYFYSNKGRKEVCGEIERNNEIRSFINEIDWDCDLHTWFREECVNVYESVRGAISWLFENERQGIVFEEDCVPTPAFFSFCEQMLNKFAEDKRVWCISGDNFLNYNPSGYDYLFSHYHWMWGWASWADRWKQIDWQDFQIDAFINSHISFQLYKTKEQARYREWEVKYLEKDLYETKCWDYAFGITIDKNNGVTVHPKTHLITNVGVSGVNHGSGKKELVNIEPVFGDSEYLINHEPPFVFADLDYDYKVFCKFQKPKNIFQKILIKLKQQFSNND